MLATVPDKTASARPQNLGTNVRVEWDAPSYDGAAPILGYRVKFKAKDGIFREAVSSCEGMGAHQSAMLSTRSCTVPMTALTDASSFDLD